MTKTKAKSKTKTKAKAKTNGKVNAKTNGKSKVTPAATTAPTRRSMPKSWYQLRSSPVDGTGMFAMKPIEKGASVIEYIGERISHEEADRRHAHKDPDDNHTFLFTIDATTVIDADVNGNDARFINHSCDPNCEVIIEDGHLLVEAIRSISPGEELSYDYNITRAPEDPPEVERVFACRCGAVTCRGTMLAPPRKPKPEQVAAAPATLKPVAKKKSKRAPPKKTTSSSRVLRKSPLPRKPAPAKKTRTKSRKNRRSAA